MSNQYQRYGDYIVNRKQPLGNGKYGVVWRGYQIIREGGDDWLEPVAIKESAYDQQNIQEINTLQILTHPNIIRYIDYKISGDSLFMVMELCEGGTLEDLLMQFSPEEDLTQQVLYYYAQIVKGMKFMYDKNILHRDLKPSNLLVKGNRIKIADFGTSKLKNDNSMIRTLVGTPLFASPQILELFESQKSSYTEKSDIWSLGLILYLMFHYQREHQTAFQRLKHSLPWSGKNSLDVLRNIQTKPLQFNCPSMPPQIKTIVSRMLTVNVEERMSFKEYFSIELFHPPNPKTQFLAPPAPQQTLMGASIVNLELSESNMYDEYELTLINENTLQPKMLRKETIDLELHKLLELCDTEDHEEKECHDAIKWYQLVREEAEKAQSVDPMHDLLLELELQLHGLIHLNRLLIKKISTSQRGIRRTSLNEKKDIVGNLFDDQEPTNKQELPHFLKAKSIREKYFAFGSRFEAQSMHLKQMFEAMMSSSNLLEKQKLLLQLLAPSEHLLHEIRSTLQKRKKILMQEETQLHAMISRQQIHLHYDLLSLLAFQSSWKAKAEEKRRGKTQTDFFERYRLERAKINAWQLIGRIRDGLNKLKI